MAIVLPVVVDSRLVGSAVLAKPIEKRLLFVSSLHLFGAGTRIQLAAPPHGGSVGQVQVYPLEQIPALEATVVATNPFADLAVLCALAPDATVPRFSTFAAGVGLAPVGTECVVLGYPFAPLGSVLETYVPCFVTALGRRRIAPGVEIDEVVLSTQAHPGSSGSAVVGRSDGIVYGILRGALAPPEVMRIGDIPIATDSSVTFATSAHLVHELLDVAIANLEVTA